MAPPRGTVAGLAALGFGLGLWALAPAQAPPAEQAPPPGPVEVARVELAAVGDVMMHLDVKNAGARAKGGLGELWAGVAPLFRRADIAFANLETPVAPVSGGPGAPFQFNAPAELPAALKGAGIAVVSVANNHAFDQGHKGLAETLERVEAAGLVAAGAGRTRAEAEAPRILEARGLKVAFLACTDVFNANLNGKADRPWVAALDPEAVAVAVREARRRADAVVVSVHWGAEYLHAPLERQRRAARILAEAGADVILGHHPHVLQPVETIANGDRRTLVAYSLGNFISNQDRMYQPGIQAVGAGDSRDGVLFACRLVKVRQADGTERVHAEMAGCEPLWTLNNWRDALAGRAPRELRVVAVDPALREAEADLERLLAETPRNGPRVAARQEAVKVLRLRKARIAEILGKGAAAGSGS